MNQKSESPPKKIATAEAATGNRKGRKALSAAEFSVVLETVVPKDQDPHALQGARDSMLEVAIGREVRAFRNKLDISASENMEVGAPENALSALLIDWPLELMTSARTAEAADWLEPELSEDTVRKVVAPEPGP